MRWAAAVAVALTACGGADALDPLALPVDQPGPFHAGYREVEVTYQPDGVAGPRTIVVSVWYPTEDTDGYAPAYHDLFRDDAAFEDATPAPPIHRGGYPVHVYSHGWQGFGGTSYHLMDYFASHGWVAVAPNHAGNLLFEPDEIPTSHYFERPMDVAVALDAAGALDLPGEVNTEAVVMSGHSFGTYTAWSVAGAAYDEDVARARCAAGDVPSGACTEDEIEVLVRGHRDPRVVAAIPMAGGDSGWFGGDGYDAVAIPMLLMTGTDDDVGAQALFDKAARTDLTWIDVTGGCHQLFGLGGCHDIDGELGFAIVNTYALAFARHHVLGDDGDDVVGIVTGRTEVSDLVAYRRREP